MDSSGDVEINFVLHCRPAGNNDILADSQTVGTGEEVQRISILNNSWSEATDDDTLGEFLLTLPKSPVDVAKETSADSFDGSEPTEIAGSFHPADLSDDDLLKGILNNVESPDSFTSEAWVETLLEIAEVLSIEAIRKQVIPVAVSKAQPSEPVSSRLSATKLFARLSAKLDSHWNKTEVLPCVQSLCQDVDRKVRESMCRQLPMVAKNISVSDWKSAIFPLLIELSKDSDSDVFDATLDSVSHLLSLLDDDICTEIVVPLVRNCFERALSQRNRTTIAVAKHFGRLCHGLSVNLTTEDRGWFLSSFSRLCAIPTSLESGLENSFTSSMSGQNGSLANICRQYCAFNFPAMVLFARTTMFKYKILPLFGKLCQDADQQTRKTIAAGFHEVAKLLDEEAFLLTEFFVEFVRSGDIEVLNALAMNLGELLNCLYKSGPSVDTNGNVVDSDAPKNPNAQAVTSSLLYWISSLKGSPDWRSQETILDKIALVAEYLPGDELFAKVVPPLMEEILTQRALPCRHAALNSLLKIVRHIKRRSQRQFILLRLREELCASKSCHKRMLYLDGAQMALSIYSRLFFKQNFLDHTLSLMNDKVINVRLKLCRLLPSLKSTLKLSNDLERLSQLEAAIKHMMASEKSPYAIETLLQVIKGLDKYGSNGEQTDTEDGKKQEEEMALFAREDSSDKRPTRISPVQRDPLKMTNGDCGSEGSDKETQPTRGRVSLPSGTSRLKEPTYTLSRSSTLDSVRRPTKTAIVRPSRILTRSPSPRPPVHSDADSLTDGDYTKAYHSSYSGYGDNKSAGSRYSSANGYPEYAKSMENIKSNGHIANGKPPTHATALSRSTPKLNLNSSLRPPAPTGLNRRGSVDSRTISARESSLPRSSVPPGLTRTDHIVRRTNMIPSVKTGAVRQSVARFEVEPNGNELVSERLLSSSESQLSNGLTSDYRSKWRTSQQSTGIPTLQRESNNNEVRRSPSRLYRSGSTSTANYGDNQNDRRGSLPYTDRHTGGSSAPGSNLVKVRSSGNLPQKLNGHTQPWRRNHNGVVIQNHSA